MSPPQYSLGRRMVLSVNQRRDFGKREVGKFERLFEHLVAVAVLASEDAGLAHEIGLQRPHLKFFGGHALVVRLDERDFVEQPVSAAVIGDMLRSVRENHFAVEACAIPMLAAGKLAHHFGRKLFGVLVAHDGLLLPLVLGCSSCCNPCPSGERG